MFENEEQLKERLARNIAFYREHAGDTQLELAEKLNYSDKSISKWERGEGVPSIFVLTQIAAIYGVTAADLLAEQPPKPKRVSRYNHAIVTLLSFVLVWLVATFVYIMLRLAAPTFANSWLVFIYAIPVNAVVAVVFTYIWWPKWMRFCSVSALIWSTVVCVVCSVPITDMNLFYILAAVFQVMVVLWFMLRKERNRFPKKTDRKKRKKVIKKEQPDDINA